jgi:transcriptional regulator GlxA family with amidase domain
MSRHVTFFVYPEFASLGLSGPLDAFTTAETLSPGSYRADVVSMKGGPVRCSAGLKVSSERASANVPDTFIVVGSLLPPMHNLGPETIDFIRSTSLNARRAASVCTGAFLLARSGLLDGRKATTHWQYVPKLKAMYPAVRVEEDRIFANDDGIWSSAGVTAGIDMTLALIEEDLGNEIARAVARMLVVYYRRPGGQRQYSSLLEFDTESDRIRNALHFAREHLRDDLSVERLASASHLSVRQFSRAFVQSTGLTPARAIERLRVEVARARVEDGRDSFEEIARAFGFEGAERMRGSFLRILGRTPQDLRRLHRVDGTGVGRADARSSNSSGVGMTVNGGGKTGRRGGGKSGQDGGEYFRGLPRGDLASLRINGALGGRRILAPTRLRLLEPVALAVQLQDADVLGQPVEKRAGEPLIAEYTRPLVERQIGGHDRRAAFVALAEGQGCGPSGRARRSRCR